MPRRAVVVAVALLLACGKKSASTESAASARAARETPGPLIAPPPASPDAGVLGGPPGVDDAGAPRQWVDRAVLRGMLLRKDHAALAAVFERLQADFESDPMRETWPMDAADAFDSAEPAMKVALDEWASATPASFAPYLARGTHLVNVGYTRRGTGWARETPAEDLDEMKRAFAPARTDLEKALTLRPRLVAAQRRLIQIGRAGGDPALAERAIGSALDACPSCLRVRVTYMVNSTPRWGGSYAKMRAFAARSASAGPTMRLLTGFIDLDQADAFEREKEHDAARAALDRACALGDRWEFFEARGLFASRHGDNERALADLDHAVALRPGDPEVLSARAGVRDVAGRYEGAALDLRDVFGVAPTEVRAKRIVGHVVDGLVYEADRTRRRGDEQAAVRLLDLAAELAPDDPRVTRQRGWTILGDAAAPDAIAELEAAVRREPDSFDARRRLDYALSRQRRWDRVVPIWDEYLAAHPDDGRAYLERGGAYFHLGKMAEAKADARRACERGVSEGCVREKQVR